MFSVPGWSVFIYLFSFFLFSFFRANRFFLLDPWPWSEGSYELGSVRPSELLFFCPSVLPSGSFLRIGSLGFSKTQDGVRDPCIVVPDRAGFLEKNIFAQKMGKMGRKWAKNRVF